MHFDSFDAALRDQLLQHVGQQLTILAGAGEGVSYSLHECCQAWLVDLPEVLPAHGTIESYRRDMQLWHHQIWRNGEASFYARSQVLGGNLQLLKVARSQLALQFAAALAWLDKNEASFHEPPAMDWRVCLLIVGRYDFQALILVEDNVIQKALPLSPPHPGAYTVIDGEALRSTILARPVFFGLG